MLDKITNFLHSGKGRDLSLIALILLTGSATFGLGRLSATRSDPERVTITYPDGKGPDALASVEVSTAGAVGPSVADRQGTVVASKNGEVYHLPWCSGASRIKEENRVWYDSIEEARSAGLRPAANCSGLQ